MRRESWSLFVQHRRDGYLAAWPCADPTRRKACPLHGETIGPVTAICKPCHDGLYEQAAGEFKKAEEERKSKDTEFQKAEGQ